MKKIILNLIIINVCFLLGGCSNQEKLSYEEKQKSSTYYFADIIWTREADHDNDIETLEFSSDGSFKYSCSCGKPINDSDLCKKYIYDEGTNEIILECTNKKEETVTSMQVIKLDEKSFILSFDGELRTFTSQ